MGSKILVTYYLDEATIAGIIEEAQRLECTMSAVVQRAWAIAEPTIRCIPGSGEAAMMAGEDP